MYLGKEDWQNSHPSRLGLLGARGARWQHPDGMRLTSSACACCHVQSRQAPGLCPLGLEFRIVHIYTDGSGYNELCVNICVSLCVHFCGGCVQMAPCTGYVCMRVHIHAVSLWVCLQLCMCVHVHTRSIWRGTRCPLQLCAGIKILVGVQVHTSAKRV